MEQQAKMHVQRVKHAPHTFQSVDARAIQLKLKDPLLYNAFMLNGIRMRQLSFSSTNTPLRESWKVTIHSQKYVKFLPIMYADRHQTTTNSSMVFYIQPIISTSWLSCGHMDLILHVNTVLLPRRSVGLPLVIYGLSTILSSLLKT